MTEFSSRTSPQLRSNDVADATPSAQTFPFARTDFQREIVAPLGTHANVHTDPVAAFLRMPESEQKRAIETLDPTALQQIERAKLQGALSAVVGVKESEILIRSNLPNETLQEVLLIADRVPFRREQEVGAVSIGQFIDAATPPVLGKLHTISDHELHKVLAASTVTEMSNLPAEISTYIFDRLKETPHTMLDIQRKQFENEHLLGLRNIRDGSDKNATTVEERLRHALLPDFISTQNSAGRIELQGWKERASSASHLITRHLETLKTSDAHERVAHLLTIVATQSEQSRKAFIEPHIVNNLNNASAVLFRDTQTFNPSTGVDKITQAGDMYAASAHRLDVTVGAMQVIRDGAFVVVAAGAATIAAPVVFGAVAATGAGAAFSTVASVGAGAAVGAVVDGTLTAVTEGAAAPMHVALGNKSIEEAQRDYINDVKNGAQRGGIAGLQGGATALARLGILSLLGKPETLSVAQTLGVAAMSSATGRAAAIPVERIQQFMSLRSEFIERYGMLPLTEEAKIERFGMFLESQGFTIQGISQQALKDLLFSAGTSAVGARFQIGRQSISNPTLSQNLKSEVAEFATNVTVGVAKAYLETPVERRTFANLVNQSIGEVFSAMTGAMQGRATGSVAGARSRETRTGSPLVTDNGVALPSDLNVVTHGAVDAVRQKYIDMALSHIEQMHNRPATPEERLAIEEFAGGVHAFWDKDNKQMHIAETDPGMPESLKAMHEALIAHEKAHADGKDEVDAIEEQAHFLAERGLEMTFVDDEILVSKIEQGADIVVPSRAEIADYVSKRYAKAEELAPSLAAGNTGVFGKRSSKLLTSDDPKAQKVNEKYENTSAPLLAPPEATANYYHSRGGDCTEYHCIYFDREVDAVNIQERSVQKLNVQVQQYWHIDPSRPAGQQESWRAFVSIDLSDAKFSQYPPGTRLQVVFPDSQGGRTTAWVTVPPANDEKTVQFELVRKEGSDQVIKGMVGDFELMPNAEWKKAKGDDGGKRNEAVLNRGHFR